jgi:CspA family cold shock protein
METRGTIRVRGRVKWFDIARGYGFVTSEDGEDVFVHHSGVAAGELPGLLPGQALEFEIVPNKRGRRAVNVVLLR